MTTDPPVYGPDMFASDLELPDPATVLNEPLPRAWSQGGMIEAVKRCVITGLREAFGNSSLSGAADENFYIDIEYPTDITQYPGIWVQFAIEQLQRAGLSMETWTKDDRGQWGPIHEWAFNGRITLTIAAMSSKDRDRLADTVIAQLAFSRPPDLVIRDPRRDAKQMRGLITALDENPYVSMTLNTDQIQSGGQTVTSGTPWAQNILLYEDNYSVACTGQFNIRFNYDGVYELVEIRQRPELMDTNTAYNPVQWRGIGHPSGLPEIG
jgi:hypothetical protein